MAVNVIRIGVPVVKLSVQNSTAVPSLSTLVFDCSAVTPTDSLQASIRNPLAAATNYQVMLALLGIDATNGGYTINYASPGSGILTVTAGQAIKVHVTNGNWPANFDQATACAVFLKKGSVSTWTLADLAYIDTSSDFNFAIMADAAPGSPSGFTTALLQSTTTDATLGSRAPVGVTYATLGPTTGGVQISRDVSSVTVSPDNAPDYTIKTSQAANISFQTLPNGVKDVVRAAGGIYATFTGDSSAVITQSLQTLLTATAVLKGNKSLILNMPVDSTGVSETRLYLGNLTTNQNAFTENWQRSATTPIQYNLVTAPQDSLLNSMFCEVIYKRL